MIARRKRRNPAGTGFRDYERLTCSPDSTTARARQKLPPYGREVIDATAAGQVTNIYIFAGNTAWTKAICRRLAHGAGSALVVPNDAQTGGFNWTFLRGLAVVLAADSITPANRAKFVALSAELIGAGVRFVAASDGRETFAMRAQGRAA